MRHIPSRWGFCFAGNEGAFCEAIDNAWCNYYRTGEEQPFTYVEIGIGNGGGLNAVHEYLSQVPMGFRMIGVDLPNYGGNAFEVPTAKQYLTSQLTIQPPRTVALVFTGAEQFFKEYEWQADFIFIDGCHGAPCVTADFLGAEKVIKPGGVIAFHDTDFACQDIHPQPHCGTGIQARKAVEALGLLNDTRPGWKKLNETFGDKNKGGHGCLFVQRKQPPGNHRA